MKKIATAGALVALAAPAVAHGTSTHSGSSAQAQCRAELTAMGKTTFRDTYGTNKNKRNAFGKCVSHRQRQDTKAESTATTNAAKTCRAAQAADPSGFAAQYGTGKKGRNAFGKCVSATARAKAAATETAEVKAEESVAKSCRTERAGNPAAFRAKYGTNRDGRNAFGKCVSTTAKAKAKAKS